MADIQQLEESIVSLSLLEAAELVKKLESRLGVSAAAAAPVMVAGGAAAGAAAPAEEKTEFRRLEGRSRNHQEEVHRSGRYCRSQVGAEEVLRFAQDGGGGLGRPPIATTCNYLTEH